MVLTFPDFIQDDWRVVELLGSRRPVGDHGRPQDCAQRKGGYRRSRLSTNPQCIAGLISCYAACGRDCASWPKYVSSVVCQSSD